jgi:heme/copper-type cytochrome/quinol oxidase subunit 4
MKRGKKARCVLSCYVLLILASLYGIFALRIWSGLPFLPKPLQVDLGISWAILALISMLTLTYVQLINKLAKNLHKDEDDEASWQKVFLSWTTGMLFVTILSLTLRITYLSFYPEGYLNSCSKKLIFLDWIILTSFFLGSFMRIGLFIDSYSEDFTTWFWVHWKK